MAVQSIQLTAQPRSALGSRANKRLRDSGQVPCVVYGHKQDVIPLAVSRKEVAHHISKGVHVFDLATDGKAEKVLVKDVQYDHLGIEVIHVDFARVSLDERVKVTVPLELKGTPKGEAEGGVLQQIISDLEIECLVLEIPEVIRHNVSELGLNSLLHISDLKLPNGVKVLHDPETIVATVKVIAEPVAAAAAEGETAEPEIIGRKAGEEEGEAGAAPAAEKK